MNIRVPYCTSNTDFNNLSVEFNYFIADKYSSITHMNYVINP